MREIKFRGRDGDDWYYGSLFVNNVGQTAICAPKSWWMKPVKAETVGEYTGLKDSKGREIYEGDIVEISPQFSVKQGLKRKFHLSAVVRWDERFARFVVKSKEILDSMPNSEYVSVIGNVYDNPELLKQN